MQKGVECILAKIMPAVWNHGGRECMFYFRFDLDHERCVGIVPPLVPIKLKYRTRLVLSRHHKDNFWQPYRSTSVLHAYCFSFSEHEHVDLSNAQMISPRFP